MLIKLVNWLLRVFVPINPHANEVLGFCRRCHQVAPFDFIIESKSVSLNTERLILDLQKSLVCKRCYKTTSHSAETVKINIHELLDRV